MRNVKVKVRRRRKYWWKMMAKRERRRGCGLEFRHTTRRTCLIRRGRLKMRSFGNSEVVVGGGRRKKVRERSDHEYGIEIKFFRVV